jgi:hypothetical protein
MRKFDTKLERSIIVSVPIDLSDEPDLTKLEAKGVKGNYASVEKIEEIEAGKLRWTVAINSTPGGNIPSFIFERGMPPTIAGVSS